jgi:two-component system CheB/CheR fusion protein
MAIKRRSKAKRTGKDTRVADAVPYPPRTDGTPIVAMGASAGGLEALQRFFENVPEDSGIGFVVITHARPQRESMLPELLSNYTNMPVLASQEGMMVMKNQVIVARDSFLTIEDRRLSHVEELRPAEITHHSIDYFFRALAADQREHAICIVLSGSGNDGTLGLKAVKAAGGMSMVQDPGSAKYSGMPESALATGLADYVGKPEELPKSLLDYCKGPYLAIARREKAPLIPDDAIHKILVRLRTQRGHDFTHYKKSTMARRIERRMNLHHLDEPKAYIHYLRDNPRELDLLLQELVISVTSFFRDPEAFQALRDIAIPRLLAERPEGHCIRVWVPGCATGEEAYSVAIMLDERIRNMDRLHEMQIFATDLDKQAIDIARNGLYPGGISADVSKERLQYYFLHEDNAYRIHKNIRDRIVFAVQNVITDPPFTHMDLIVCRNLLIYLNGDAQKQLMSLFHYALNDDGMLFLGSAETVTGSEDLFEAIDGKNKIMKRRNSTRQLYTLLPSPGKSPRNEGEEALENVWAPSSTRHLGRTIERMLLDQFAPCSVTINDRDTVVYLHGRSGMYFQPEQGQPHNNIVEMAREGLRIPLAHALRIAREESREVVQHDLQVRTNGEYTLVDLMVRPLNSPEALRGLILVSILPAGKAEKRSEPPSEARTDVDNASREELERELKYTRENLQTTIEELETSNEELKSANEELQSTNEELQSSNEELETSKEEMQSLNEELNTVNAELKSKLEALARSNDDMNNLLNSMQVATVFLDNNLRVKRYTKKAEEVVHLIESDVGRPFTDLASSLRYDELIGDCRDVLSTLTAHEKEVLDENGRHFLVRLLPYRTSENVIDGLVITIVDIDRKKRAELAAQVSQDFFESIVQTMRNPLMILDANLLVNRANEAFYKLFRMSPEQIEGRLFYELDNRQWDIKELRRLLEQILPEKGVMSDYRVEHNFPRIGRRVFLLNARQLEQKATIPEMILLVFEDVTENT